MTEEIIGLPEAVSSIVNKLVENEGARFPFLVAAVALNGSIWYSRVELIDGGRGDLAIRERPGAGLERALGRCELEVYGRPPPLTGPSMGAPSRRDKPWPRGRGD
jgi:hypothetical protein